jgi:hypothetical protein
MKRSLASLAGAAALVFAAPAGADSGAPGTTFPEQPPAPVPGCAAVLSTPEFGEHLSATAGAITTGLVVDACFGG